MPCLGIAPAPEACCRRVVSLRQGRRRFRASFRRVSNCAFWRLGFRHPAFAISRGSANASPQTPGRDRWLAGMPFSLVLFRGPVSHRTQRHHLQSLPAARGIQQSASWPSYAFDMWMARSFPAVRLERYVDDAVVRCASRRQAEMLRAAIDRRMVEVGLRLHPDRPG